MPQTQETTVMSPSQQIVLEHIERYRMTVIPALQSLRGLKHFGRKRLASTLRDLRRAGYLGQGILYHHQRYFFLTRPKHEPQEAGRANSAIRRTGPLSKTAKIRNYALLAFCCLNGTYRRRLTQAELKAHFPHVYRPGLPLNYYVDTSSNPPQLGFVRVDTGGHGRWDRIAARCAADLDTHTQHPGFQEFIERNAFEITLLTALPQKAERLREFITTVHPETAGLVRIVVFPELLNLIAPPPIRE